MGRAPHVQSIRHRRAVDGSPRWRWLSWPQRQHHPTGRARVRLGRQLRECQPPSPLSTDAACCQPTLLMSLTQLHGVQTSCIQTSDGVTRCPTSFPNSVNYGATFNRSLFYDLGATIATELRALWLAGATEESPWSGLPHAGLDCWSPTINIAR